MHAKFYFPKNGSFLDTFIQAVYLLKVSWLDIIISKHNVQVPSKFVN